MKMNENDLHSLYAQISKHCQYQALPSFMRGNAELESERYKHFKLCDERLEFVRKSDVLHDANSIVEVGANIGFFALSLAHENCNILIKTVEAEDTFCEITRKIATSYELSNVHVESDFFPFLNGSIQPAADVAIIFNVIHHGGYEYDQEMCNTAHDWFDYSQNVMEGLAQNYKKLVMQIGYNWGGDRKHPIHATSDPVGYSIKLARMFDAAGWRVVEIGIPVKKAESYDYLPVKIRGRTLEETCEQMINCEELNACSDFDLSEFFQRPIFILENTKPSRVTLNLERG